MYKKLTKEELLISVIDMKNIHLNDGNVMHFLKKNDKSFRGFGEVYFSWILKNKIKGWKKQKKNTMNLIVPVGKVKFVFFKDEILRGFFSIIIGENNYKRITVPPNLWYGFKNLDKKKSLIVNLVDNEHNPTDIENKALNSLNFDWQL